MRIPAAAEALSQLSRIVGNRYQTNAGKPNIQNHLLIPLLTYSSPKPIYCR